MTRADIEKDERRKRLVACGRCYGDGDCYCDKHFNEEKDEPTQGACHDCNGSGISAYLDGEVRQLEIGAAISAWSAVEDLISSGTPLDGLACIAKSQLAALKCVAGE